MIYIWYMAFCLKRVINYIIGGCVRGFVRVCFDRPAPAVNIRSPAHVVMICWNGKLGDAIVSSPFYREIRKLSQVNITVVTVAELEAIYREDLGVDRVIITQTSPELRELLAIQRTLGIVDVVIYLVERIQPEEIIFLSFLKATRVYSLDDSLSLVNYKLGKKTRDLLFAEKYIYILQSLDLTVTHTHFRYCVPLCSTISTIDLQNRVDIVFNPYASHKDKSLGSAKIIELLSALAQNFPEFTIGILSSHATKRDAKKLECHVAMTNVRALEGIDSYKHAAMAINTSLLCITVDTAIVHMAVGLGKKLIAIYPDMGRAPNPWLPPQSHFSRVVISHQNTVYRKLTGIKNMDNFLSSTVIEAVHELGLVQDQQASSLT